MIKDWLQWYSLSVNIWMCQEVIYQTYDRKINKSKCAKNEGLSRIPIDFVIVRKEWRKTIMSCLNTSKKEMKLEERFEKHGKTDTKKFIFYTGDLFDIAIRAVLGTLQIGGMGYGKLGWIINR